jgi:hypothetical protein
MMTRTTLVFVGALVAVVSGCDSEVNGGGGGAGGGSGGGSVNVAQGTGGSAVTGTAAVATTSTGDTTSTSSSDGGSTAEGTSVTVGPGGAGGGNTLGECEFDGGSAQSVGSGGNGNEETFCEVEYACDGGRVEVDCRNNGSTEVCDCTIDGSLAGSCVDEDQSGCTFPQNCCFNLLGGHAEPNPGPYGSCDNTSGSAVSSGSSGNEAACGAYYDCDGGEMQIECSTTGDGGDATCECIDSNYFLIGTCSQPTLDCDYESNCCNAIFN